MMIIEHSKYSQIIYLLFFSKKVTEVLFFEFESDADSGIYLSDNGEEE
jgi:hypothetical protein